MTQQPKKAAPLNTCPHYKKCGGCQMQNLTYEQQLQWKQKQVERLLGKFAKVLPIIGMTHPYHYRNKVQAAFGSNRSGEIISGVYQSSTHRIVSVESCQLEDQIADQIITTIRSLCKQFKIQPYNEYRGTGLLRHVLIKRGFQSNEIMVVIVTVRPIFPSKNHFIAQLRRIHPQITTIIQNVNPYHTSLVLGDQEKVLYGPGTIIDTLCGCKFRISAKSFYQVNPVQTEVLYGKAMEFAQLTGDQTVIDAYCGIGTIGLIASRAAKAVVGVELNADAVRDAIANAKLNQITNARFYVGDAGAWMVEMAQAGEKADVVFMDPPRAGSDKPFLTSLLTLNPKRVVYISCNPETLARDLSTLTDVYHVEKIQPVDMFPHTHHVETVALLSRQIDVHKMKLNPVPFEMIKRGEKTIELRLFDEKRQQIKTGDKIVFTNNTNGETLNTTVVKLHRFNSFDELYKSLPLLQCGYTSENVDKATPSDMVQYYSNEEQQKYGVVGIELFRPKQITDESVVCLTRK